MGAGASTADPQEEIRTIRKGQVAEDASAGAILVKSASGLTKSSGWLDEPDPYAMTRLGPVGSSWADKDTPEACERTSCVASDTHDPVYPIHRTPDHHPKDPFETLNSVLFDVAAGTVSVWGPTAPTTAPRPALRIDWRSMGISRG